MLLAISLSSRSRRTARSDRARGSIPCFAQYSAAEYGSPHAVAIRTTWTGARLGALLMTSMTPYVHHESSRLRFLGILRLLPSATASRASRSASTILARDSPLSLARFSSRFRADRSSALAGAAGMPVSIGVKDGISMGVSSPARMSRRLRARRTGSVGLLPISAARTRISSPSSATDRSSISSVVREAGASASTGGSALRRTGAPWALSTSMASRRSCPDASTARAPTRWAPAAAHGSLALAQTTTPVRPLGLRSPSRRAGRSAACSTR